MPGQTIKWSEAGIQKKDEWGLPPVLYILIGISGSGKSTWANKGNCVIVDPDHFVMPAEMFDKKKLWKQFRDCLKQFSEEKVDIVADATHLKRQWRYITARQVGEEYRKVAVVFHTPFELCCERRKERFERWQMEEMRDSMEAVESKEKFDALIHVYPREERTLSLVKI